MKLFLDEFFRIFWKGKDPFAEVELLEGKVFRAIKNRRTVNFMVGDRSFFLKHHRGVGWGEIFKNLLSFKLPVIGAGNEFRAIRKLEEVGLKTMHCSAYGEKGFNPAARNSFIITADIGASRSLEEVAAEQTSRPVSRRQKTALIRRVAAISRTLHDNGINHRDYYLCHFLMKANADNADGFDLYLIDLHRVGIRRKVPARYLFKDMGGLWFSAMDARLSRADCLRFIAAYAAGDLRTELATNAVFWQKINHVGEKLYWKEHNRPPRHAFVNHE